MLVPLSASRCRVGIVASAVCALIFAALLFPGAATSQENSAEKAPVNAKKILAKLTYQFEPSVFTTKEFPAGALLQEEAVQKALGPVKVETTFYNAKFEEVKEAGTAGRYGAVVRIMLGDGTQQNRFISLYRTADDVQWKNIGPTIKIPVGKAGGSESAGEQQDAIAIALKDAMGDEGFSPKLAKVMMGLAQAVPGIRPESLLFDFMARDDLWWFELRKKIGLPKSYLYVIKLPEGYESDTAKRWPLILSLHGSGERGDFLPNLNRHGLLQQIAAGRKVDAIVVAPQCPANEMWSTPVLSDLIDDISAKNRVDPDRVIVTGLSMGGFGTWALALAYPDRFSAIVPVCGGGNPIDAARLSKLPVWAFHGQLDSTVPVQMSEALIATIRQAGGEPHLTIYPDVKHDSWTRAYANDDLYTWLLAQQRGKAEVKTSGLP